MLTIEFSEAEILFINSVFNESLHGLSTNILIETGWTKEQANAFYDKTFENSGNAIVFSENELLFLIQATSKTLNGIDQPEFQTRTSFTKEQANNFLAKLQQGTEIVE